MECIDVYNRYGEKTGESVGRDEAHRKGLCHKAAHLWLINAKGEILIQQRSASKDCGAGMWYVSVAGHVQSGESLEDVLIRETEEELGLDIRPYLDGVKYLFTFKEYFEYAPDYTDSEFLDVFALQADFGADEVVMQAEEVQAVKYITLEEFRRIVLEKDESFWQHGAGFIMLLAALEELDYLR